LEQQKDVYFCHFLISWLTQAWMIFLSCSTTCTKFW